jgi:replicative DNA helicase
MLDHERSLLEAILHDPLVVDSHNVQSALFVAPEARAIFDGMVESRRRGATLDLVTLSDVLKETGRSDLIVTAASLSPMSAANAGYCARKLRGELRRRELSPVVRDAMAALADPNCPIEEVIQSLSDGLVESWKCAHEEEDPSIEAGFPKYVEELRRRYNDDGSRGIQFGIECLDSALGSNIGPGEMVALAARPGVGKTALALQLAAYNATKRNIPATVFSLEMTRNEVYDRLFAPRISGGVGVLRNGMVKGERDRMRLEVATKELYTAKFRVFESSMSPASVAAHIRRDAMVYQTRLFVIDYLGLLDFGGDTRKARWEIVGDCTKMLKRLALDLGVSIIICVQLGRDADGREPMLSDLRDSGAIEQDCNRVILLHRPDDKNPQPDYQCDAIIPKNRGGPRGRVSLYYLGAKTIFEQADRPRDAGRSEG